LIALILIALLLPASLTSCKNNIEREDVMIQNTTIPLIDANAPAETETATFALGWFWGPDSWFGSLNGVTRTRVGYAGGTSNNPTYYNLGNHSETVQIDYDPTVISYEELLSVFWKTHNPAYEPYSQQYKSAIFFHNEEQQKLATESKLQEEARRGEKLYTEILPFSGFTLAEDYHQKYYLKNFPDILEELARIYPDTNSLINSTAAARINGYAGGYGTIEQLETELKSFGLSASGEKRLLDIGKARLANNSSLVCPIPN